MTDFPQKCVGYALELYSRIYITIFFQRVQYKLFSDVYPRMSRGPCTSYGMKLERDACC